MCRIAGIVNFHSPPTEVQVTQMRDSMIHGGPDDSGNYVDDKFPLAFGFRRLSFLDLSANGHQPMMDAREQVVLIFNGEIYNFQELWDDLNEYSFKSKSDSEVIIYAYLKWGLECFSRFNGMFAIALYDKRINKLFLARGPAGIKPLYYSLAPGKLYFASEIRAFKTIIPDWPENEDWKKYFLMFGHLPEPITTLQNVQPLPKGTILEIDLPSLRTKSHTFFRQYYNYTITTAEEAIAQVRSTLIASVKRHLISDAPIGLFLSGGIDSSLLTILAKHFIPDNLQTLSIVFENENFSEKNFQDIVIAKTGTKHKSFLVTEQMFNEHLDDIIRAMDQPSNDGINTYFICKFAKSYGLKAALSGLGADELFGGYQSFYRNRVIRNVAWLPEFMFKMAGVIKDDRVKKIEFLSLPNALGTYLLNRGVFAPSQVAKILDCSEREVWDPLKRINFITPSFVDQLPWQEKISFLENLYMQNQLLKDTDYMGMWHGIEVRVPFLDKQLIEVLYSIPPELRYNSERIKYLLVEAFKDILPEPIWNRTKQGFTFPLAQWMKQVRPPINDRKSATMKRRMEKNEIHWSRYWSYVLCQQAG